MNLIFPYPIALLVSLGMMGCGGGPIVIKADDGSSRMEWSTSVYATHPLVGKIWSTSQGRFVDLQQLSMAVKAAPVVLIGERHDQPDHHRMQAWLIEQLKPGSAVGFEMLNEDQAEASEKAQDIETLRDGTRWARNGWPDFKIYAPIFEAIYGSGHTVHAIHPSRKRLRSAMMGPTSQNIAEQPSTKVIDPNGVKALKSAVEKGHCGYATPSLVNAMVLAQSFKDQWMTNRLMEAPTTTQRAVIAGNGHVRRDFGMPRHLKGEVLSIGILEVNKDKSQVQDYQVSIHDFVWFTPRLDDIDPCEKYRAMLEKMKTRKTPKSRP